MVHYFLPCLPQSALKVHESSTVALPMESWAVIVDLGVGPSSTAAVSLMHPPDLNLNMGVSCLGP